MSNNKDKTKDLISIPVIKKSPAMKKKLRNKNEVISEAKGTISKLFPLFGFIEVNHPIKASIYFDAFCVEHGKVEKLSDLNFKIGQAVYVCAKKGRPDGQAKFRATKVWRMANHELFSRTHPPAKKKNINTTKMNKLVSNGKLSGISSSIISSQQDSDISDASLDRYHNDEKLSISTSTSISLSSHSVPEKTSYHRIKDKNSLPITSWDKLKKITNQNGRIHPEGENKACIRFGNPEEVVLTISDVVFDNNKRIKNLIWHIDDNQRVQFDAIEANFIVGSWIATKVWIGEAPESSLPNALKNEKYWQELVNKYASLFEVEYTLPNPLPESVNVHPRYAGKENWNEVQSTELSINCASPWDECEGWDSQDNTGLQVTFSDNGKFVSEYEEDYISSVEDEPDRSFFSNSKFQPTYSLQLESLNSQKIHRLDSENIQTRVEKHSEESFDSIKDHFDCHKLDHFSELSDSLKTEEISKNVLNLPHEGLKEEKFKASSDEPSLELFKTLLEDSNNSVHDAVSAFCSQLSFNEVEDKLQLAKFSNSIVQITEENKGLENIEELKSKGMNFCAKQCDTTLQEVVSPSVKNVVNATGHLKKIDKYCVWIKVKNTLVPVCWSHIYVNGRRVCGITKKLEDVLEENAVVHFAYMHTFAYNSEWVYVYSLWKGKKPKQISEPTVEEFLKELELKSRSFSVSCNSTYSTKKQDQIGYRDNSFDDQREDSSTKSSDVEAASHKIYSKKQKFGRVPDKDISDKTLACFNSTGAEKHEDHNKTKPDRACRNLYCEDSGSVTAQTPKLFLAEFKSKGIQTKIEGVPLCTCLHSQHQASVKKVVNVSIQTESCEAITDSTQTFSTGEIFYSRVYLDAVD
ncbi:uncharacterized protein LOC106461118 isoform X2 [Limulus polyphemus]|uniref:Uncharacterized protein LOC106461118 isoform X2 n=1 Tax=Limulus polyphemus TaxID=6850 RepID=A0ABM1B7H1_LIMPO|nr:uncharacterized protein LOC106461118 isoform X2 [Limulus polyphemus]